MDFLGSLGDVGLSLGGTILAFLFVLTIIVFIHEMGHFLAARWCGVAVSTFSIGFGPELAGFNDRHGTRWKLSAIPLGGYVKFLGDVGLVEIGVHGFDVPLRARTPVAVGEVWSKGAEVSVEIDPARILLFSKQGRETK